jgi:hypothetical protein
VFDVMKLDFRAGGNKKKVQGRFQKANNDQGDDWACQDRSAVTSAQRLASEQGNELQVLVCTTTDVK